MQHHVDITNTTLEDRDIKPHMPREVRSPIIADRARPHGSPYVMDILRGTEWTPYKVD